MALNDFIARIKRVGMPTASRYIVEFLGTSDFGNGRDVSMMVDQAALPGINIASIEVRTFGEFTDSPYGVNYTPVNLSLYVDNEALTKKFFDNWSFQVWNRLSRTIGYYNDFVKDVRITLLDKNDTPIYQVMLYEAWPKTIQDISLDAASRDLIKLNVTLAYKYWESVSIDAEEIQEARNYVINPRNSTLNERLRTKALTAADVFGTTAGAINTFQWGNPADIAIGLSNFGTGMGSSISHAFGRLGDDYSNSGVVPRATIIQTLDSLSSNFVELGSGVHMLGEDIMSPTAAYTAMTSATGAIGTNLGTLGSIYGSLGVNTRFGTIGANFSATSAGMSGATTIAVGPRHLQNIGGNMVALGAEFKTAATTTSPISGSTARIRDAFSKLGYNMDNQGESMYNGALSLKNYTEL